MKQTFAAGWVIIVNNKILGFSSRSNTEALDMAQDEAGDGWFDLIDEHIPTCPPKIAFDVKLRAEWENANPAHRLWYQASEQLVAQLKAGQTPAFLLDEKFRAILAE